jgi:hypothetical protein
MTQRLVNRFPEWTHIRQAPFSIGQQFLNPIALDLQDTAQQLAQERYNMFVSTADIKLLDLLYKAELSHGLEFSYTDDMSGKRTYVPPTVYGTLNGTEYQLTQAESNDIKTLAYDNIPSRIENAELNYAYESVLDTTYISNLTSSIPNSITIVGHLYITLKSNTSWETRTSTKVYYPKIYITGLTRKGTTITETIPLRYNGTFKTVNEWQEVLNISASYLDNTATVSVEIFPTTREAYLDIRNISVPVSDGEKFQFTKLGSRSWGSTFVSESFTVSDMDAVRSANINERETNYEIELLDSNTNNVTLVDFIHRPNTNYIYAVDNDKFYIYDVNLPYPEASRLINESPEPKIDLFSDRWIYARDEVATIKTRILDDLTPPYKVRWHILDPDNQENYIGLDGSLWSTSVNAWIDNTNWEEGRWQEEEIDITLSKNGTYIITLEAFYYENNESITLSTKYMFFVPSITPEAEFNLPSELTNPTNICYSSDGEVYLLRYDGAHKLNIFFDYFLVDYDKNTIWLKEEYSSVRIAL